MSGKVLNKIKENYQIHKRKSEKVLREVRKKPGRLSGKIQGNYY